MKQNLRITSTKKKRKEKQDADSSQSHILIFKISSLYQVIVYQVIVYQFMQCRQSSLKIYTQIIIKYACTCK